MNAPTFLAAIELGGVRLRRDGDELKIQTRRGVSADGYIDLIRLNRAGLLATLAGEDHDIPWVAPDDLTWVRVSREEVAEAEPPADWDGTLPADCAWSHLCQVLGPCPRVFGGRCRCPKRQFVRVVEEPSDTRQIAVA